MHKFKAIKNGSIGEDVLVLQTVLSMLNYTGKNNKALVIDGECGENTVYAINSFQSSMRAYGSECGTNGTNDSCFGEKCWKLLVGDSYA